MDYETKKMKSKHDEPQDRLSELPDSLILSIFEFLPMKYVVSSQILSHRWKNLWTINPCLYFDNETETAIDDEKDEFRRFVTRSILGWRGARLQKFKVSGCDFRHSLYNDLNLWMRFAVDKGVDELDISFRGNHYEKRPHFVPQCLYSCSSLRKLSLKGMNMNVRGNVDWNKLKSLTIQGYEVSGHAINQILCGSPLLEVFITSFDDKIDENSNLCFRSSSLKELSICKNFNYDRLAMSKDTELEIWTPNLEILAIWGMPYGKCLLMNVSSLTHMNLGFHDMYGCDFGNILLGNTLGQIIPAIQHVKGLALSEWCIEVLVLMKMECLLSPFLNVKLLTLRGSLKEQEQIVDILEFFPQVKTLLVEEDDTLSTPIDADSVVEVKPNPSKFFLEELRTVKVTCFKHDSQIFPLIKSLLKYASKLEKMTFRVEGEKTMFQEEGDDVVLPSLRTLFKASQELLRMPRSSPTAELIFFD